MDQIVETAPPIEEGIALLDLRDNHCRWPLGAVREPAFRFCGKPKHTASYCEAHAKLAFREGARLPKGW